METAEIRATVHRVLTEEMGPFRQPIQDVDELERDLDCDSLDRYELTMAFEIAFDLEIKDRDVRGLKTVGELIAYLDRRVNERAA